MPSLKSYRDQIKSVTSTRKITSAMKMVAASKLRRAQDQAEAAQPYARAMAQMMQRVSHNVVIDKNTSKLLIGTGSEQRHLLIVVTADRGLCGGFNANLIKKARYHTLALRNEGKEVEIICVGRKGNDVLSRMSYYNVIESFADITGKNVIEFSKVNEITEYVLAKFEAGDFDICSLVYNKFRNILSQEPSVQQLIPFELPQDLQTEFDQENTEEDGSSKQHSLYEFEPGEAEMLDALLPKNINVQMFRAMLDSGAGEQAARMTAMDSATSNASDMIKDLSLKYNRARQAYITKELIEIISGAEAI